ncbi:MAG: DDE-type integrase/transposase/recombinase [Rhodobacteraceae bacterium]|nr:DDE-type integrase/transposase/recombinase [Paracoccaceae bacterium]
MTARRDAKAARLFLRQAQDTVQGYQPLTIVTDMAHNYAKVIGEINGRRGPVNAIRRIDRKYLNRRIESDHAALKQ